MNWSWQWPFGPGGTTGDQHLGIYSFTQGKTVLAKDYYVKSTQATQDSGTITLPAGTYLAQLLHFDNGDMVLANYNGALSSNLQGKITWQLAPSVVKSEFKDTTSLHKLLYGGQKLDVNPTITNNTGNHIDGQERFYLSTNKNASTQGDQFLTVIGSPGIHLDRGNSATLPYPSNKLSVLIPTNIQPGTYYIKAVFLGNSNLGSDSSVAVSPALTAIDSKITADRAAVYEQAVALANILPNYVPLSYFGYGFTTPGIKSDIKVKEESIIFKNYPYLDTNNIPTIGWGFALLTPEGVPIPSAVKRITALGLDFNNVVANAYANGPAYTKTTKISYPQLTSAYGNAWFDELYDETVKKLSINLLEQPTSQRLVLDQLPANIQAVLIDLAYNIGPGFVYKFPKMLAYIRSNKIAFAGFELLNSDYATQRPSRAIDKFRILVSGHEDEL